MEESLIRPQQGRLAPLLVALLFSTVPFVLPNTDVLHRTMIASVPEGARLVAVTNEMSFLKACALAAMFTALVILFICLLATHRARLNVRIAAVGSLLFLAGQAFSCLVVPLVAMPALMRPAAILLGVGTALMVAVLVSCLRTAGFGELVRVSVLILLASALLSGASLVVPPLAAGGVRFAVAAVSSIGLVGAFARHLSSTGKAATEGENWWDVFGRFDSSVSDLGEEGFQSLAEWVLFFLGMPFIVLLIITGALDLHHNALDDRFPLEMVSALVAALALLPIAGRRFDRVAIQAAYRLYLPVLIALVFVVGNFVPWFRHELYMNIALLSFGFVYSVLIVSLLLTMASRMPSLRLPAAGMIVFALAAVSMLCYVHVDFSDAMHVRLYLLMGLLALSAVILLRAPMSQVWSLATLDPQRVAAMLDPEAPAAPTLDDRCDALAAACRLTPREAEVLRFLGRGHGSAYIAGELVVAESTVRSHVKSIYRKVGVRSREELISRIDETDPSAR